MLILIKCTIAYMLVFFSRCAVSFALYNWAYEGFTQSNAGERTFLSKT